MLWTWLCSWWRRTPPDSLDVVLFTRQGCHLCEDAWELLQAEQRRVRFALSVVDVDSDPKLVEAYGTCVPVVMVNGRVRFRGRINKALWRRLLRAE
jgi:glutaredoxin